MLPQQHGCPRVLRSPAGLPGRVLRLEVIVGRLSGVVPASLRFCFETIVAGTVLAGASLEIDEVPTACECARCGHGFVVEVLEFACPACGSDRVRVTGGHEIEVVHLEIDEPPAEPPWVS